MLLLRTDTHRRLRHPGHQPVPCPAGPVRGVHLHDSRPSNPNPSTRPSPPLTGALPWVTKIFVTGDVVSVTLQASGGGIQTARILGLYDMKERIMTVETFVQIFIFGFFIDTIVPFHRRIIRQPMILTIEEGALWKIQHTTSLIVIIRRVLKVVEYLQENDGRLVFHEVFLYIFDTLLAAVVMAMTRVWYVLRSGGVDFGQGQRCGRIKQ
ncbi:RTA1 [Colletotrichum musicola]|uniref:RTA1 n=1 Tax=Colletotrichum musicola TaxID=2175873 RepID=A0A8H6JY15_9PEZI|nr:RTA1 [Colletotrichum musicola]